MGQIIAAGGPRHTLRESTDFTDGTEKTDVDPRMTRIARMSFSCFSLVSFVSLVDSSPCFSLCYLCHLWTHPPVRPSSPTALSSPHAVIEHSIYSKRISWQTTTASSPAAANPTTTST